MVFWRYEDHLGSSLDYFGARYYAYSLGRFTSVDPSGKSANTAHPQSWNRYSYALNNPLKFVDPDGREPDAATVGGAVGLAFIPGPQQALVLGVAAVFIGKAIYDNRHEIGETITGVVEGVKDLVSTPGGKATELDQSPVKKGGQRDDRKLNSKREQSAKDNVRDLKEQLKQLDSTTNKTPADKREIRKLRKAIKREQDRARKSSVHSRGGKGPR